MTKEKNSYCKCLYYSGNALARIMTKMAEEEFSVVNLAPSYAFMVMSVNNNPGIQAGELASYMMLTPSTVTRLIEKLEFQELVYRQTDGRITHVFPTEKALSINDAVKSAWLNLYKRYSGILGEENVVKLTDDIYKAVLKLDG